MPQHRADDKGGIAQQAGGGTLERPGLSSSRAICAPPLCTWPGLLQLQGVETGRVC
jgi:hypothetical protein